MRVTCIHALISVHRWHIKRSYRLGLILLNAYFSLRAYLVRVLLHVISIGLNIRKGMYVGIDLENALFCSDECPSVVFCSTKCVQCTIPAFYSQCVMFICYTTETGGRTRKSWKNLETEGVSCVTRFFLWMVVICPRAANFLPFSKDRMCCWWVSDSSCMHVIQVSGVQPTFVRRTSRNSLETYRAINLLPPPPVIIIVVSLLHSGVFPLFPTENAYWQHVQVYSSVSWSNTRTNNVWGQTLRTCASHSIRHRFELGHDHFIVHSLKFCPGYNENVS